MRSIQCCFLFFLFSIYIAAAEETPKIPLISVTGTAELNVAPDEIKISVDIDNREKVLKSAKEKTDEQAKKLLALVKAHQILPKDVITSYVAVTPVRSFRKNEARTILYFQAAQRITITLHDFSKYDSLMDSMTADGLQNILVEYDVADMPSYRKKARMNAILAAQEKAKVLAEAIGQKIGKAYSIEEVIQKNQYATPNVTSNTIGRISTPDEGAKGSPLSIGNIEIRVSVEASFYLE
jgi:uncharacterized protein